MANRKYSNQTGKRRVPSVAGGDYSIGKTISAMGEVIAHTVAAPFHVVKDTVTDNFSTAMENDAKRTQATQASVKRKMTPIPGWDRK